MRTWAVERRARTRRLIELGGVVERSGLIAMLGDDDPDATLLGALIGLVDNLVRDADRDRSTLAHQLKLWRRRGRRAFGVSTDTQPGIET